jgi:hypothetical protein
MFLVGMISARFGLLATVRSYVYHRQLVELEQLKHC